MENINYDFEKLGIEEDLAKERGNWTQAVKPGIIHKKNGTVQHSPRGTQNDNWLI